MTEREDQLEQLLANFLKPIEHHPLEIFIRSWFGKKVIPFEKEKEIDVLDVLKNLCKKVCQNTLEKPIKRNRPNEVGNDIERYVKSAGKLLNIDIESPDGSGCPNLLLTHNNKPYYIEVKTQDYSKVFTKEKKSQRFFYLSLPKDSRIELDASHLLIAFDIHTKNTTRKAIGYYISDCYGLICNLKFEAQSYSRYFLNEPHVIYKEQTIDSTSLS